LATLGGFVSFCKKILQGGKWKIGEFVAEVATSAFAGVVTFYLCQWAELSQLGTAAMVGIAGHSSSKAIAAFDDILTNVLSKVQK
jgi:hypothetical protein